VSQTRSSGSAHGLARSDEWRDEGDLGHACRGLRSSGNPATGGSRRSVQCPIVPADAFELFRVMVETMVARPYTDPDALS
jgi:hypothetical protein